MSHVVRKRRALAPGKFDVTARKRHLFHIRSVYVPLGPKNLAECVAKIWAQMWPDCRYPRYEHLTPEQRYACFGPGGEKRFGPEPRWSVIMRRAPPGVGTARRCTRLVVTRNGRDLATTGVRVLNPLDPLP